MSLKDLKKSIITNISFVDRGRLHGVENPERFRDLMEFLDYHIWVDDNGVGTVWKEPDSAILREFKPETFKEKLELIRKKHEAKIEKEPD